MKITLITSSILLGLSSAAFSGTIATVTNDWIIDPVTGVVVGTAKVVNGIVVGTKNTVRTMAGYSTMSMRDGYVSGKEYLVTEKPTGDTRLVKGVGPGTAYYVNDMGSMPDQSAYWVGDDITNLSTGKTYRITRIKQGTMDVIHNGKLTRYEYVDPIGVPVMQ